MPEDTNDTNDAGDESVDVTPDEGGGQPTGESAESLKALKDDELLGRADPVVAEIARRIMAETKRTAMGGTEAAAFIAGLPDAVRGSVFGKDPSAAVRRLEEAAETIRSGFQARKQATPDDLYDRAFRYEFGRTVSELANTIEARGRHTVASGTRPTEPKDPRERAAAAVAKKMAELNITL